MANGDQWIGVNEAARRIGVSAETIRRWADSGRLRSRRTSRPPGGWRQILVASVEAYLREMEGGTGSSDAG